MVALALEVADAAAEQHHLADRQLHRRFRRDAATWAIGGAAGFGGSAGDFDGQTR